ncbi:hypothetical protein [Mycobacterium sp. ITM-2016-00318]|uniref:hypothetical protein n=1 Tax=Mycobacterium sp. ITM-2016-00318 TaxID=2099693 RepID=UPI00115975FF|nr:hypothetical protein [Mycobacterium sp. ITM-2016-00318]WNG92967.1 hypothetical protein C6A82_000225 [Mycobacterium sp. ITM-2016-00318]
MTVRKIVAGSVLAAGLGAVGIFGAGTAFAVDPAPAPSGPGISFSSNGGAATTFGNGATANSGTVGKNNQALAINTGLSPLGSSATALGERNNVVSIDGHSVTGSGTSGNNVITAFGVTTLGGNTHDNTVVNVGGVVTASGQGNDAGVTNLSACGSTLTGQADHITVNKVPGGLC